MQRSRSAGGFSVIEALVAATVLAVTLGALARLSLAAARATDTARRTTVAVMAARQKIEQLRAASPDDPSLATSPAGTLDANVEGCYELLDARGGPVGEPGTAAYIRRWSVQPLPNGRGALALQVRVLRRAGKGWLGGDTRLFALKPMQVP